MSGTRLLSTGRSKTSDRSDSVDHQWRAHQPDHPAQDPGCGNDLELVSVFEGQGDVFRDGQARAKLHIDDVDVF